MPHRPITRRLRDLHGIQTRGGCVGAGPCGQRLAGISRRESREIRNEVQHGNEDSKPGRVRLSLDVAGDDATAQAIVPDVRGRAENWDAIAKHDGTGKEKSEVSDQRVIA